MASEVPNLFLRLNKWASRQDENFLTESLAAMLQFLLEREPRAGVSLVAELTCGFISIPPVNAASIAIQTQVSTDEGRPDLEIRSAERMTLVEVKVESELRRGQLEGYRALLASTDVESKQLVLLSQHPTVFLDGMERPDVALRWFEVADWFEHEIESDSIDDLVARFFIEQFHAYLKGRGMTIAHVDWQMPTGVRSLRSLLDMIAKVLDGCGIRYERQSSWEEIGLYLDRKRYWIGINYTEPEALLFSTWGVPVNPALCGSLPGQVELWDDGIHHSWKRSENLEAESIHFFARTKPRQMQWLEAFVKECLATVKQVELPLPATGASSPRPNDQE